MTEETTEEVQVEEPKLIEETDPVMEAILRVEAKVDRLLEKAFPESQARKLFETPKK